MNATLRQELRTEDAFASLAQSVRAALETYANVHRGSGFHARLTTRLFEQARALVLEHLGLDPRRYVVVFSTPRRAAALQAELGDAVARCLSSEDLGLPLGVRALALHRRRLPGGAPSEPGGGTARLVGPGWVVWARAPERLEAGTPAIVNVIAFARALQLAGPGGGAPSWDGAPAPSGPGALEHLRGEALLERLRQTLVGRGQAVPTVEGVRPFINLDNAASTPTFEPILRAALDAWTRPREEREALVGEARATCAEVLGAAPGTHQVLFTANTTGALNLVAESLALEAPGHEVVIVNTLLEHNSNELPWRQVPGATLERLPVDAEGFLDLDQLDRLLAGHGQRGPGGRPRLILVAVSGASNVLGTCNDLPAIARIVHRHRARLLVDAAQLVAHRPVAMDAWGLDYLAFSAHKAYAPFGSGALVARKGLLKFGAPALAAIRASGEENVGGIAALGEALRLLQRVGLELVEREEQALTAVALRGLAQVPGLTMYGTTDPAAPRFLSRGPVLAFSLQAAQPGAVAEALAERGIGVRAGCHCAHLLIKRLLGISPALERFQRLVVRVAPGLELPGVVRASLGLQSTAGDVEALVAALRVVAAPGRAAPGRAARAALRREVEAALDAAARRVFPEAGGAAPRARAG